MKNVFLTLIVRKKEKGRGRGRGKEKKKRRRKKEKEKGKKDKQNDILHSTAAFGEAGKARMLLRLDNF